MLRHANASDFANKCDKMLMQLIPGFMRESVTDTPFDRKGARAGDLSSCGAMIIYPLETCAEYLPTYYSITQFDT